MFGWFKKTKHEAAPSRKPQRFFSTDVPEPDVHIPFTDPFASSFQRTASDFKISASDGKAYDSAMDAATCEDGRAIGSYAMDAPSQGNTTSLKPIINPIDNIPSVQLNWYAAQGFIGYQICAMIAQHWLIDKACTMPGRDAMRHGYDIGTSDEDDVDPKIIAYIKKRDKQMRIKENCIELVRFNRIFGIRIALPIVEYEDEEAYQKPFNPDGVKPGTYRGISQIDPYWITPELDFQSGANPASIHFYEPTWWRVNGRRIHRTHLIVLRNGQVADVLKPSYLYGGIPLTQKIAERVYASERSANEAPQLLLTKRTSVWKMDIAQAIANQGLFETKMNWFSQTRDNFGIKAIGLDDEVEQLDTTLSDLSETIELQYAIVAAAAEVPSEKLMGSSPTGLNATGNYEADSYHEMLESIQEHDMQPLIERHHLLLMRSEVRPKFGVDFEIEVKWNPTDSPTAKEQAEINQIKANTAKAWVDAGVMDGQDARTALVADKDSGYTMLDDELPEGIEYMPESNVSETINPDDQT